MERFMNDLQRGVLNRRFGYFGSSKKDALVDALERSETPEQLYEKYRSMTVQKKHPFTRPDVLRNVELALAFSDVPSRLPSSGFWSGSNTDLIVNARGMHRVATLGNDHAGIVSDEFAAVRDTIKERRDQIVITLIGDDKAAFLDMLKEQLIEASVELARVRGSRNMTTSVTEILKEQVPAFCATMSVMVRSWTVPALNLVLESVCGPVVEAGYLNREEAREVALNSMAYFAVRDMFASDNASSLLINAEFVPRLSEALMFTPNDTPEEDFGMERNPDYDRRTRALVHKELLAKLSPEVARMLSRFTKRGNLSIRASNLISVVAREGAPAKDVHLNVIIFLVYQVGTEFGVQPVPANVRNVIAYEYVRILSKKRYGQSVRNSGLIDLAAAIVTAIPAEDAPILALPAREREGRELVPANRDAQERFLRSMPLFRPREESDEGVAEFLKVFRGKRETVYSKEFVEGFIAGGATVLRRLRDDNTARGITSDMLSSRINVDIKTRVAVIDTIINYFWQCSYRRQKHTRLQHLSPREQLIMPAFLLQKFKYIRQPEIVQRDVLRSDVRRAGNTLVLKPFKEYQKEVATAKKEAELEKRRERGRTMIAAIHGKKNAARRVSKLPDLRRGRSQSRPFDELVSQRFPDLRRNQRDPGRPREVRKIDPPPATGNEGGAPKRDERVPIRRLRDLRRSRGREQGTRQREVRRIEPPRRN